jgi:hypothetical protein
LFVCSLFCNHAPQANCVGLHRTVQLPLKIGKYPGFDNKNFQVIRWLQLVAGMTVANWRPFPKEFARPPCIVLGHICCDFRQRLLSPEEMNFPMECKI